MANLKTQAMLDYISRFMTNFDNNLTKIEFTYRNETSFYDKLVCFNEENVINSIKDCLNTARKILIKKTKTLRDLNLKISSNSHSQFLAHFMPSKITLASIELIGHLKFDLITIANRINHLHLQQKFLCYTYRSLNIGHVVSLGIDKIAHIDDTGFIKILNPSNGKIFNQIQICLTPRKKRFQYCRAAHNCILAFFELDYEKDYVLEIYDLITLKLKSSRSFKFYVDNLCSNEIEIIIWSPNNSPYLAIFDYELKELISPTFEPKIFDMFYSMSDFKEGLILFHSQHLIGVVSRETGKLINEISMDLFEKSSKIDETSTALENQHYMLHAKFEYINLRFVNTNKIILTTHSSIILLDFKSGHVKAKNNLKSIRNVGTFWINPFRFDINLKDGYAYIYDSITGCLIYF
jgi:hypothetical protein